MIKKRPYLTYILLVGIFLISFLLMIFSSRADTQTTDEAIHLFAGYTYLTKHDFRLDPEHPPLLKEISALPLLFFKNLNTSIDGLWDQAENFYFDSWQEARKLGESFFYQLNNPEKLLFWGRLPFIFLTLLLGFLGFFWARKLYGMKAGIFAAFLILFLPNILAHGRLINTDLGITLFIFLTVFCWGNFLKKPSLLNFLFSGLSLGLVLSSKYTGIIILPVLLILLIIKLGFFQDKNQKVWPTIGGFLGILPISFFVIWLTYGFSVLVPPEPIVNLSNNINLWSDFKVPANFDDLFSRYRVLLFPAQFYKGLFLVAKHAVVGHSSFLLGQSSNSGWWYYFPVAIFYKTPIPVFVFLGLATVYFKKLRSKYLFDEWLLIIPAVLILLFSMFSKANLGVRHILPIFPFLLVFASKSINLIDFKKQKILSILFSGLILWYFASAILSFPNYLAYFNEFAGGQNQGHKILADSNLDWGQDILRLKKYLSDNKIEDAYIFYPWDGDVALKYYQINYQNWPWDSRPKGTYIISATYMKMDVFAWLKDYPYEQITPGLFLYRVN